MKAVFMIFLSLFGFILAFCVNVAGMVYGWGIDPKSWPVIILCSIVTFVIIAMTTFIAELLKD